MSDNKQQTKRKPQDYRYIAAWCAYFGSNGMFQLMEQTEASDAGAPIDTVFRKANGDWVRIGDVKSNSLRARIEAIASAQQRTAERAP